MVQFSVNTQRIHPYKNFKFRVSWDGRVVAGVSKVGALKRTTAEVTHRVGNDLSTDRYSPGRTTYETIDLERGITFDREFENWANTVYSTEGDGAVSLAGLRKDITIELLNLQGTVVQRYNLFRCWVTGFQALPELDANSEGVAFENITIRYEGFSRDTAVVEVAET